MANTPPPVNCSRCGEPYSSFAHQCWAAKEEAEARRSAAACSAIPAAQVLVYQPELTHSVWTDVVHRKRSRQSLEAMLRKSVRSGEYVGYRMMTIHAEYVGISWPNA